MRLRTAAWTSLSVLTSSLLLAAEGGGEGGAIEKVMPYLPVTAWAIISFLIVLGIVWIKLMPSITSALDERATTIRESLAAAEKAKADAEAAMSQHQGDLEKARAEAREIIEEGKADAERVREKIISDANSEATQVAERTKREIDLAKKAALDDLKKQSVSLALDLAGSLVQKSLSESDHQDLIKERTARFSA